MVDEKPETPAVIPSGFSIDPTVIPSGFSIDPTTWIEPKQSFPGEVTVSEFKLCNEKYMAATEFRPALPRAIVQWQLEVRRLDAKYLLPDGSQADVIRYGGIDMEKWSARENELIPINAGFAKETLITNEWKRIFQDISDPAVLVGRKAMFEWFASKRMARGRIAKNVLLPVSILAPDWAFTGDVELIQVTREQEQARTETTSSASTNNVLEGEAAIAKLVDDVLPGQNVNAAAVVVASLPPELRTAEILSGLAGGTLFTELQETGRITVAPDGVIAKA